MNETDRLLNLDQDDVVEVTLGGKTFTLRQQRKALIEQVVRFIYVDLAETEADEELTNAQMVQLLFDNWEKAVPAYALMFGVEPRDSAYQETLDHLAEYLTFAKAQVLFNRWYELNQVERFFAFLGNPLIPMKTYQRMLAEAVRGTAASEPAVSSVN